MKKETRWSGRWAQAVGMMVMAVLLALVPLSCAPPSSEEQAADQAPGAMLDTPREQARRRVNLGVAYLAQFQPASAITEFQEALVLDPDNVPATVDLGVAHRVAANLPEARRWLEKAVAMAPDQVNALYNLALVERVGGDPEAALAHLDRVVTLAPDDPSTHYNRGLVLNQLRRPQEALAAYDRVLVQENWNASAHYARGRVLLQMGKEDEAMVALERSQELSGGQMMATSAGQQYGEQGILSLAVEDMPENPSAGEAVAVTFTDVTAASGIDFVHGGGPGGEGDAAWGSGLVLVDVDDDEDLDLFVADAGASAGAAGDRLYLNDGTGSFTRADLPPAPSEGSSTGVTVGDYDNDGHVDIYVGRWGANRLLRNEGNGTFGDAGPQAGADHAGETLATSLGDLDHDGDLDLLLADASDGLIYLRNDGNGRFSTHPAAAALADAPPATGLLSLDLDGDRDVDLFTTGPGGLGLWLNNRDGSFSPAPESWGQVAAGQGLRGILPVDLHKDGRFDLILTGDQGATALVNSGRTLSPLAGALPGVADAYGIAVADYDLDGFQDLVMTSSSGAPVRLFRNLGGGRFEAVTVPTGLAGMTPAPARAWRPVILTATGTRTWWWDRTPARS
jgi:tetratricopeptide (TPR) repeat protein